MIECDEKQKTRQSYNDRSISQTAKVDIENPFRRIRSRLHSGDNVENKAAISIILLFSAFLSLSFYTYIFRQFVLNPKE